MSQPPQPYAPDDYRDAPRSGGRGCLFWGCLIVVVLVILAAASLGLGGYWLFTAYSAQVEKYTSETPADLPTVELSEEELKELHQRIDQFEAAVREEEATGAGDPDAEASGEAEPGEPAPGEAAPEDRASGGQAAERQPQEGRAQDGDDPEQPARPTELVLSADEINALIAEHEELRRRAHIEIEDGTIRGDVSIPTDAIPRGQGRYFNASARFEVSMENGILVVRLTEATVKGEPVPEAILEGFRQQNLARDLYQDPQNAELLRKFESVRVEDDRLVLKLRQKTAE